MLGALSKAHAAGLVHGDVKAANLLCFGHDATQLPDVRLSDFGIALRLSGLPASSAVAPWGTPGERAPEQDSGAIRDAGPWTDLFGLGRTLQRWQVDLPGWEAWCLRLTQDDAAARFSSARAAFEALRAFYADEAFEPLAMRMGLGQQPLAIAMAQPRSPTDKPAPFQSGDRRRLVQQVCAWVADQRRTNAGGWLHLEGAPGYGCTTALHAVGALLGTVPDVLVLRADARAPLPSVVLQALRNWLRVDGLAAWEVAARLTRWRSTLGLEDRNLRAALLATLLRSLEPDPTAPQLQQAALLAGSALTTLCGTRPSILLVDNVVPDTTAWRELTRFAAQAGLLVLSVGGPAYDTPGPTKTLSLPGLTVAESDSWLEQAGLASPALRERAVAWAGGDPRLVARLVSDQGWPPRHAGQLEARLRALGVHDAPLLSGPDQFAAAIVCGLGVEWSRETHANVLQQLALRRSELRGNLTDRLVVSRVVVRWRRDADRLAVQRSLLAIETERRHQLARAVAEVARAVPAVRDELLHWTACLADDVNEIAERAIVLARSAFERGSRQAALALLDHAARQLEALPSHPAAAWFEVSLFRINLHRLCDEVPEVQHGLAHLRGLVDETTPARVLGLLALATANYAASRQDNATALREAERACSYLAHSSDRRIRGHAAQALGAAYRRAKAYDLAAVSLHQAHDDLAPTDAHAALVCRLTLAHLENSLLHNEAALAAYEEVIATAQDLGYPHQEAQARNAQGEVLRRLGSYDLARAEYEHALALFRPLGAMGQARIALLNLALNALMSNDTTSARHPLASIEAMPPVGGEVSGWLFVLRTVLASRTDGEDIQSLRQAWAQAISDNTLSIDPDDPDYRWCWAQVFG